MNRSVFLILPIIIPQIIVRFFGTTYISTYSIIDKGRTAAWQIINPLLYKYVAEFFKDKKSNNSNKLNRILIFTSIATTGAIAIAAVFFSNEIIDALSLGKVPGSNDQIKVLIISYASTIFLSYSMAKYMPAIKNHISLMLTLYILMGLFCIIAFSAIKTKTVLIYFALIPISEIIASIIIIGFYRKQAT